METEVRKLPRKTIYFIAALIVLGIIWLLLVTYGKSQKATKILNQLGYEKVSDVKVYGVQEFLREDINVKGYKYTVRFIDNIKDEECNGFILKDFRRNVEKDLDCQKIKKR
ncbi:MAG: hypothetical protein U9R37_04795 [Campylobacterota bacterium]|nr:hypothetical protein [Campylobacterota bacterium]